MIDIEIPLNISRLGSNYSAKAPLVNKTNKQKQNVLLIFFFFTYPEHSFYFIKVKALPSVIKTSLFPSFKAS